MFKNTTAIVGALLLTACATTPDITLSYYQYKWNVIAQIAQTVGCNAAKSQLVVLNSPSVTTVYSSDRKKLSRINIKELDGVLADSEITMTFTDDGRLKSINQSTTGQGENIIKSAVALATTIGAFSSSIAAVGTLDECNIIDNWGAGKPVTLIYKAMIDVNNVGQSVDLSAAPESEHLYRLLLNRLPKLRVVVSTSSESESGPKYNAPSSGVPGNVVLLELQKIGSVVMTIMADATTIGITHIVVPQPSTYKMPIPKAALFGKQSFTVLLSEAGAVTSVGYGKITGTTGVVNALNAIANTQTAATEAADLMAQADLIAQQQRLVQCQTKPDECK